MITLSDALNFTLLFEEHSGESPLNINDVDANRGALVERVKRILLKPKEEWAVIDTEETSIGGLFVPYVVVLAAIPAVAQMIGSLVFGYSMMGVTFRPTIGSAITMAAGQYVLGLLAVVVLALVIDALAPRFNAQKNRIQAFKVAAYACTAAWVVGVVALIPPIGFLSILGLYSLYLFYIGLPLLMKAPAEKALSYTVVTILVAGLIAVVASFLLRPVLGGLGVSGPDLGSVVASKSKGGSVSLPGGAAIDIGGISEAAKRAETASKKLKDGSIAAVPAEALQKHLPETIGRFRRTEVESRDMGMGGIGGSHAEGRYESGDEYFELSITDMPAVGPMAALGSAMGLKSERKTETGYQRTHMVNGNYVDEKWDGSSKNGSYNIMVAERFAIKAEGRVSSMDDLTTAISAVKPNQIAQLAK